MRSLIDDLPNRLPDVDEVLCRALFGHLLARMARESRIGIDPAVERALGLLEGVASPDGWRRQFAQLVDLYAAIADANEAPVKTADYHVDCVLRFIDARYKDPRLALRDAAADARLSPWHVSRLLKRHTGNGFLSHVRHRRVVAAQYLLANTSLSAKEIAVAVGFGDSSQFSRHFKLECGIPPITFRHGPRRPPRSRNRSQESSSVHD
jgi:AraC-like DNA-binding protein